MRITKSQSGTCQENYDLTVCAAWLWCDVLYVPYWMICRYMNFDFFEWFEPNDHLPLLRTHQLPLAPERKASEGWWGVRMVMCFLQLQEKTHGSTRAGAMHMKSKASWENVRIERMVSQLSVVWNMSVMYANKWPSILWLSVFSFPVVTVYSSEGLETD